MKERKKERIDKGNIYCFWRAPLRYLGYEWRKVRKFFERGLYGYSYGDLYNFDSYLAKIISNGVKEFNEGRAGYPCSITDEEWSEILEEISDCFYRGIEENGFYKNENELFAPFGSDENEKWFEEEMHLDKVRGGDIERGLELLGKWFWNLWD
ncbi:hypothetical protein M2140_000066 [Clostridiales Family XIII bacterium PM5-7]